MSKTAARRKLSFSSLDEVMPDVDRLMNEGYTTVGKWTLGQMCNHLAIGFTNSIDGYPVKEAPWLLRKLVAPVILWQILRSDKMPEGIKGPPEIMPKDGLDDRAEVEALRASIRLYSAHTGPLAVHPFFEQIDRDRCDRLNLIHCSHHLSFAIPKGSA